uniref:Uncharacterized protein n=1 Tax=Amphimedon queenslandica TaxID=400682 RepID=A0A1X7UT38_AMPQE
MLVYREAWTLLISCPPYLRFWKKNDGRLFRHSAINDILQHAFAAAGIPARPEPSKLTAVEGRRPDGVTLVSWKSAKCDCWDFTCHDTLAPSYVYVPDTAAGSMATVAKELKVSKPLALRGAVCVMGETLFASIASCAFSIPSKLSTIDLRHSSNSLVLWCH